MEFVHKLAQKDYNQKIIDCAKEWKEWVDKAEKAINKINMYIKNGIVPGKQLLLTYETSSTPVDMRVVSELLKQFLV